MSQEDILNIALNNASYLEGQRSIQIERIKSHLKDGGKIIKLNEAVRDHFETRVEVDGKTKGVNHARPFTDEELKVANSETKI